VGRLGRRSQLAWLLGAGAALVLVAACGSTSPSGGTSNPTATAVAAAGGSSPAGATSTVMVGTAAVSGSSEQVLTESDGWTLYYNTDDTSTTASCTGTCAGIWPPLLLASGSPSGASSLTGSLTAATTGNGRQVEYDGHPLYIYSGDSGADQANGEGKGGVWYVATPSLGSGSGASASAASAPNGY
jgi:predicted lipoprotein with Yx(FWY)xxD motif